jgi:hypothetical protein
MNCRALSSRICMRVALRQRNMSLACCCSYEQYTISLRIWFTYNSRREAAAFE